MARDVKWLKKNIDSLNIADDLDENEINRIAERVHTGYTTDLSSRSDWEKQAEEGLKIARQVQEVKNYPFTKAANVKYPLIAISAINFAARVYPQIIQGTDIVKAQIVGQVTTEKEARAKRVSQHMSYQLLEQMSEWESDTDQLLTSLPVMGMYFRKTYYDTLLKRNRSVGISPLDIIVNQKIKDLETARRITERVYLYKNDVIERQISGMYLNNVSESMDNNDEDKSELFLEQHTWIDLDGDGYAEPYIIVIHEPTKKLARITARYDEEGIIEKKGKVHKIIPVQYYTDYGFLPDPKGEYYKVGFSHLLGAINEAISTVINQLLDSGHWANTHNGFIAQGVRIRGGKLTFEPNEWKIADVTGASLKDGIVPLPTKEPSTVLFQLLGLLIETGKTLSSVSETMTGEMPGQNTPATTVLAMIEQGMKVFSSIYKRVYRSLKSEYKKLYRLNRLYMDDVEYIRILDSSMAVAQSDYSLDDLDIVPTADPTISSEAQRLARARAVMESAVNNPCPSGKIESLRYYYEAIGVPNIDKLLPKEEVQQALQSPPPDPKIVEVQAKVIQMQEQSEHAHNKDLREQVKLEADVELIMAQIKEVNTRAIKNIADAEKAEAGTNIESYKIMADKEKSAMENQIRLKELSQGGNGEGNQNRGNAGGNGGVDAAPDNTEGIQVSEPNQGMAQGESGEGFDLQSALSGADSISDTRSIGQNISNQYGVGDSGAIEARADGGAVEKDKPYVVGEKGAEIIIPDRDGRVVSNSTIKKLLGMLGSGTANKTGKAISKRARELEEIQ